MILASLTHGANAAALRVSAAAPVRYVRKRSTQRAEATPTALLPKA